MAWTTWVLNYGFLKFRDAYEVTGLTASTCDMIKWPLVYFLKAWDQSNHRLFVQVHPSFLLCCYDNFQKSLCYQEVLSFWHISYQAILRFTRSMRNTTWPVCEITWQLICLIWWLILFCELEVSTRKLDKLTRCFSRVGTKRRNTFTLKHDKNSNRQKASVQKHLCFCVTTVCLFVSPCDKKRFVAFLPLLPQKRAHTVWH